MTSPATWDSPWRTASSCRSSSGASPAGDRDLLETPERARPKADLEEAELHREGPEIDAADGVRHGSFCSSYSSRQYWRTPAACSEAGLSVRGFSRMRPVSTIAVIFLVTRPDSPGRHDPVDARRADVGELAQLPVVDRERAQRLEDLVAGIVGQHGGLRVLHDVHEAVEAVEAGGRRAIAGDAGPGIELGVVENRRIGGRLRGIGQRRPRAGGPSAAACSRRRSCC